uniref:Uncharacterized protein n=1 Tax=Aurelia sp. 3 sensu Dawson et al. (2005) TaxID=237398 RepID=A0A0E4BA68_9CNID|nr:hypothetical protein [Aurelia sp. 3 sensu Dawson et al. (2005)]
MKITKSIAHNELTLHILLPYPINQNTLTKVNSQLSKHLPNYLTSWVWLFAAGKYYTISTPKAHQSFFLLKNKNTILQKIKIFSIHYNPTLSEIVIICKFSGLRS